LVEFLRGSVCITSDDVGQKGVKS